MSFCLIPSRANKLEDSEIKSQSASVAALGTGHDVSSHLVATDFKVLQRGWFKDCVIVIWGGIEALDFFLNLIREIDGRRRSQGLGDIARSSIRAQASRFLGLD